jgi:hypothetical protein
MRLTKRKHNRKRSKRSLSKVKCIKRNRLLHGGNSSKVKLLNWWDITSPGTGTESLPFFKRLFDGCIDSFDEVQVYSMFPEIDSNIGKETSKKILRVQFSGEPNFGNPDKFDINFVPGKHPTISSVIPIPFASFFMYCNKIGTSQLVTTRKLNKQQSKFCLFSVSNPIGEDRNKFFQELSKYKPIDSCGKYLNNMGKQCPGSDYQSKEYVDFISDYKFMICFESKVNNNYLTEKLITAYISGTIPIYWGCPNLEEYANMDSILYLKNGYTQEDVKALIEDIKKLEKSERLKKIEKQIKNKK